MVPFFFFLGIFILILITLNIGSGTNIIDCKSKVIRITRQTFPRITKNLTLKTNNFYFVYPFSEIFNLELIIENNKTLKKGLYLKLKDGRMIPLNLFSDELSNYNLIEKKSKLLAKILKLDLKIENF